MKRRSFIKLGSAAALSSMIVPKNIFAAFPMANNIGLQLYSLRNEIGENLEESLKKIADIGYNRVEAAGYKDGKFYGMDPAEFKALVDNFGMKLTSSHLTFDMKDISTVLTSHQNADIKYLVWPWIGKDQRASIEDYKLLAEKLNTIGDFCSQNSLEFGYHNHDFEFYPIDGEIPYDVLLNYTDPELVFMEIDLYWITYADKDPIAYFERFPGRFKLWHVKDMAAGESMEMTEVGSGIIDFEEIFQHTSLAGMKEFFIEQDTIKGDGFESVKESFDYLNNIL
jgi:sugar phosphate isomerase/epimerase